MPTFRIRVNPHNNLVDLATYHVDAVRAKVSSGGGEGLFQECTSAVIALAFSVEAIINFVGAKKVAGWGEQASYPRKIKMLEAALNFKYEKKDEPYRTLEALKSARSSLAHGKPMTFNVDAAYANELATRMRPEWSTAAQPELV